MDVSYAKTLDNDWNLLLREHLVALMDGTGQLRALASTLATHDTNKTTSQRQTDCTDVDDPQPITVLVHIDFRAALSVADELANALLNEPDRLCVAARDVVACAVKVLSGCGEYRELRVELRASNAPCLIAPPDLGVRTIQGVLVACSTGQIQPLGNGERRLVRAQLAPPSALTGERASSFVQCITAVFTDELTEGLRLGDCYDVTGRHTPLGFEVWGVSLSNPAPPPIPSPFSRLQAQHIDCPYRLPVEIAARLAQHLLPVQAHKALRLALLLSLASIGSDRRPVPLLLVGADAETARLVAHEAAHAAPRCVRAPWGVAWPKPTEGGAKEAWIEANALQLAAGGVCFIDDWTQAKDRHRRDVLAALESGNVDSAHGTPLRCAVWASFPQDADAPAARRQLRALLKSVRSPILLLKTMPFTGAASHFNADLFGSVFGVPIVAETGRQEEAVADFTLQASLDTTILPFPSTTLRQFLAHACSLEVTLDGAATRLIRNYFVASRRLCQDFLPVNAIETITALSEAHARLSLRTQGGEDDVKAVLALYERTRAHLQTSGACDSAYAIGCTDEPARVGAEMADFTRRLDDDLEAALGGDFLALLPEE